MATLMDTKFGFLDLPGELRNLIYEFYASVVPLRIHCDHAVLPALARSNRQIRKELSSILHDRLFPTAEVEVRVVDCDFTHVMRFLKILHRHSSGSEKNTRTLQIYLDIMTPAAIYGPSRAQWCSDARLALKWYGENEQHATNLMQDPRYPIRARIDNHFYDLFYTVRFPPSLIFSVRQRQANNTWFDIFQRQFVLSRGVRATGLNYQIERAIRGAPARQWVDVYWAKYEKWLKWLDSCLERRRVAGSRTNIGEEKRDEKKKCTEG